MNRPIINVTFTDRKRYYEGFDAYYRDSNTIPMIQMIGEYVEEQLDRYLELLGD